METITTKPIKRLKNSLAALDSQIEISRKLITRFKSSEVYEKPDLTRITINLDLLQVELLSEVFEAALSYHNNSDKQKKDYQLLFTDIYTQTKY